METQGDLEQALESYNKSLEIAERLAEQLRTPEAYNDLATVKQSISDLLKQQAVTTQPQGGGIGKFFKRLFGK